MPVKFVGGTQHKDSLPIAEFTDLLSSQILFQKCTNNKKCFQTLRPQSLIQPLVLLKIDQFIRVLHKLKNYPPTFDQKTMKFLGGTLLSSLTLNYSVLQNFPCLIKYPNEVIRGNQMKYLDHIDSGRFD